MYLLSLDRRVPTSDRPKKFHNLDDYCLTLFNILNLDFYHLHIHS